MSAPAYGQITPDRTLGVEASVIERGDNTTRFVAGGATRGANLFHSFLEFNVGAFEQIYFDSPAGIESIISRVTGSRFSSIDGLLGTLGDSDAALILINPNGISFGDSARLDVQGAFSATTAAGVELGTGLFSAIAPSSDRLLSIAPSAFFFSDLANSGSINISGSSTELAVPVGETLLLLGGDISIDGGRLSAFGGQIGLGAVSQAGSVEISDSSLAISNDIQRGNIRLASNTQMVAQRSIVIDASDIQIVDDVEIVTSTFEAANAGDILIRAQGSISVDSSALSSFTDASAQGTSGNIRMIAGAVSVANGSEVSSEVFGSGDAGSVTIRAEGDILLEDSAAFVTIGEGAEGTGGTVQVQAGGAFLAAGDARLSSSTFGRGDAGDVVIQAGSSAAFDNSAALSLVGEAAIGQGGNIQVRAADLSVNRSSLNTSTFGRGDAGSVGVQVTGEARFEGSDVLSTVGDTASGDGGNIQITAGDLSMVGSSGLSSSTFGQGNAGDVILQIENAVLFSGSFAFSAVEQFAEGQGGDVQITADDLQIVNGSSVDSSTLGKGDAGDVVVRVDETVAIADSFIASVVEASGTGEGGNIQVVAGALSVADRSSLNSSTLGQGDAGSVVIQVEESAAFNNSAVFSAVAEGAVGEGGDLRIMAGSLDISNDSSLTSSTLGKGSAGDVRIQVREAAVFDGSGLFSVVETTAEGRGGNVSVVAGSLRLLNNSALNSDTFGNGDAGDVVILVEEDVLVGGDRANQQLASRISSSVIGSAKGTGGDIDITAGSLRLGPGGGVFATSDGGGDAGGIGVVVDGLLEADGGTIATDSLSSSGGQIQIEAENVILREDSDIQTFVSFGERAGGSIAIDADALILFDDSDILAFSQDGEGGDIDLQQTALFSDPLNPISENLTQAALFDLDGNGRADINATGATASGQISTNDNGLVDNDLAVLPDSFGSTEALVASSCIARNSSSGALVLTGSDRLPQSPADPLSIPYATSTVRPVLSTERTTIQEPQGVYQLANGRLLMTHQCE